MIVPNYIPINFHDAEIERIKAELRGMSAIYNMWNNKEELQHRIGMEAMQVIESQKQEIHNLKQLVKSIMDEIGKDHV